MGCKYFFTLNPFLCSLFIHRLKAQKGVLTVKIFQIWVLEIFQFLKTQIWKVFTFKTHFCALSFWINRLHDQINKSWVFEEKFTVLQWIHFVTAATWLRWFLVASVAEAVIWASAALAEDGSTASTSCGQKNIHFFSATTFKSTLMSNIRIVSACRSLSKAAVGWRKPDGFRELGYITKLSLILDCGL